MISTKYKLILVLLAPVLIWGNASPAQPASANRSPLIGVKMYAFAENPVDLANTWVKLGITDAWLSIELARDTPLRRALSKKKIRVWLISPVFFNPDELAKNPDLYAITGKGERAVNDWVHFVCPSRPDYRSSRIEQLAAWLEECQPDGISLDFIRTFVFWEKVYPDTQIDPLDTTCFCSHCLERMQKDLEVKIPATLESTREKAAWILANHRDRWIDWKCGLIESMTAVTVAELRRRNPRILINLHIVPWRRDDFSGAGLFVAGQEITSLARHADLLSPMCYSHMVKRDPAWIASVVRELARQTDKPIIPSIQVSEAYIPGPLTTAEFGRYLQEALRPPSHGVVFWNWEALSQDQEKQKFLLLPTK